MNNRTSVALLLGVIAAALHDHADSFAPSPSLRLRSPTTHGCRCRQSTEASLFWRKKKNAAVHEGSPTTPQRVEDEEQEQPENSRRSFLTATATTAATRGLAATASLIPSRAYASTDKQLNLSDEDLKTIILHDIADKDFLVSADITRSVYDESASFTDEIDVYTMDKWIKGTQALFIPSGSRVSLVGDVEVNSAEASFRFDEDLMFNIPFKPVCSLTGKVVLTRDPNTGLITSYREYWDQSVNDVLKTAKFGKKAL
mmetsp:Transcript_14251/g.22438  ORF Transcript_14251/g.22438 Transcript_14251/m.22438 type:complete len:257 (-) Transcript_14251:884-1654(-)